MSPTPETPDLISAQHSPTLPGHTETELAPLDPDGLIALLVRDEDRAPRALIDACAARGEAMVERLAMLVAPGQRWPDPESDGEWWLRLHAVMILGLIPGERAARVLVSFMRRIERANDVDLQDSFAGAWPAFFRNKPDSADEALRTLAHDAGVEWYMRTEAVECVLALGERAGPAALDAALDWAAGIASDESQELEMRLSVADTLLAFPRERYRALLRSLGGREVSGAVFFTRKDVADAYASPKDRPQWREYDNPWEFYEPAEIAARQEAQVHDSAEDAGARHFEPLVPFVREAPKVGRNDPCPCGSGKKYKKCCLGKA